jgi:hypothetical protein
MVYNPEYVVDLETGAILDATSRRSIHLIDIRRRFSLDRASHIGRATLNAAMEANLDLRVAAVRNEAGKVLGEASLHTEAGLRTYERRYRLVLLDLIALMVASFVQRAPEGITLVVATRTPEGERLSSLAAIAARFSAKSSTRPRWAWPRADSSVPWLAGC